MSNLGIWTEQSEKILKWERTSNPEKLAEMVRDTITIYQRRMIEVGIINNLLGLIDGRLADWYRGEDVRQYIACIEALAINSACEDVEFQRQGFQARLTGHVSQAPRLQSKVDKVTATLLSTLRLALETDPGAFEYLIRVVAGTPGEKRDALKFANLRHGNQRYLDPRLAERTLRDVLGNPFRDVSFDPSFCSGAVKALADGISTDQAFDRLPILADALQDAGCDSSHLLNHLRTSGIHVRGCWSLDLVLRRI